jgi:tRNA(fMet)-specific endonuclease VapC
MKVMLDTNICIYLIKRQPPIVLKHFEDYQIGDIGISSITFSELRYGIAKSAHRKQNTNALEEFLIPLEIIPFDEKAAEVYGEIRTALERGGELIGAMDMLIAAHALSLGLPLVTHNTHEFKCIPSINVIDWTL